MRPGALATCNAASCTFDGKIVPLSGVRWIGLRQEGNVPPQADDSADIIVRKEQSVGARLTGIDATNVRSARGNFARKSGGGLAN